MKKFYPEEYNVSLTALTIIKEHIGFELPEEEAGSISLHVINAQQDNIVMEETIMVTKIFHQFNMKECSAGYIN
nr:PRD domain-containing protein [Bacillus cereus]